MGDTLGEAKEFRLIKSGSEVIIFDPAVFLEIKSPEKNVDMTFLGAPADVALDIINGLLSELVRTYNLRTGSRHDNT